MAQANVPYAELLVELRQLCQAKRTGTLFITSDHNLLAQFSLQQGEIVFLYFQNKRGVEALPLILNIRAGHCRFTEGPISNFRAQLPPTADILNYLGAPEETPPITQPPTTKTTGPSFKTLSEAVKNVLREELTEFIGPMATIVCGERLSSARDLESALDALSEVLANPTQINQFKASVRKKLGAGKP